MDARRTETTCVTSTCVAPRHVMRRVILFLFLFFSPNEQRAGGGGEGGAASLFFFFLPCSADHKRDWPPCKVVLSGWQPMR